MIVRVGGGLDEERIIREVRRALRDPGVDTFVVHKPGSHALLVNGDELVVDERGHWQAHAVGQADGCGR